MLARDVPVHRICEALGLDDSDLIYEVIYDAPVASRSARARANWVVASRYRTEPNSVDLARHYIAAHHERKGVGLAILEQGCGTGWFAASLARQFPDCCVDAVELTEAGVAAARRQGTGIGNLHVWQGDGYRLSQTLRERYDVVLHLDVLEHVPRAVEYLDVGLALLKEDGLLLFGFPPESYWRFWGWPKLVLSRLLRRPFEVHARSHLEVERHLERRGLRYVRSFNTFALPRRLYLYCPQRWLASLGRFSSRIEERLQKLGLEAPLASVFYAVWRAGTAPAAGPPPSRSRGWLGWRGASTLALLTGCWCLASALMVWEVVRGRRALLRQS